MRKRLLDGLWCSAEGLVYEEWVESVHVLPPTFTIPSDWPRYWAIDWGYTDPLVLLMCAKDGDGRLYLYREYYKTGMLVEDVAKWATEEIKLGREPRPRTIVCDHDPENAATFSRHCLNIPVTLADKSDRKGGIQKVKSRLRVQGDGRPRIFVLANSLTHPADPALLRSGLPCRFVQEIVSYAWNPNKDEPEDGDDHAMDAMRYLVAGVDANVSSWGIR
jgi:phage terminase large subunit